MSLPAQGPRNRTPASRHTVLADPATRRVQRPAPLRQAVYEAIVELIVHGTLKRGPAPGRERGSRSTSASAGSRCEKPCSVCRRTAGSSSVPHRAALPCTSPPRREVDQLLGRPERSSRAYSARLAAEARKNPRTSTGCGELQQDGPECVGHQRPGGIGCRQRGPARLDHCPCGERRARRAHRTRRTKVGAGTTYRFAQPRGQGRMDRARRADQGYRRRERRSGDRHHDSAHGTELARPTSNSGLPRPIPSSHQTLVLAGGDALDSGIDVHRRSAQEADQRQSHLSGQIDGERRRRGHRGQGGGPRPSPPSAPVRRKPGHSPSASRPLSGRRPASSAHPMTLSTALCRPTSSRTHNNSPPASNNAAACRPACAVEDPLSRP